MFAPSSRRTDKVFLVGNIYTIHQIQRLHRKQLSTLTNDLDECWGCHFGFSFTRLICFVQIHWVFTTILAQLLEPNFSFVSLRWDKQSKSYRAICDVLRKLIFIACSSTQIFHTNESLSIYYCMGSISCSSATIINYSLGKSIAYFRNF